jgi:hypothetical protein
MNQKSILKININPIFNVQIAITTLKNKTHNPTQIIKSFQEKNTHQTKIIVSKQSKNHTQ